MCRKSPAIVYFYRKVNTTKKSVLFAQLEDSPLTVYEFALISDVISGLSIKELAEKHHLSESRISQAKREICQKIQAFDLATR